MIFTYKKWDNFCSRLIKADIKSIPANKVGKSDQKYLVLKHDVETDVRKAYKMAQIEANYGHRGSYYVQAYLMQDKDNIKLLSEMQDMGHEISYHYDVLDSNKGNIDKAISEFEKNKTIFEQNGFILKTVCQHGNPVIERIGYTSNRDFFRNPKVKEKYPEISDIMVNFKQKHKTDYLYYSDAGRKFKLIFDPINNDVINSDDKNIPYENLDELYTVISKGGNIIISTHPHRWCNSAVIYTLKCGVFKLVKFCAKLLMKIPFCKKIMSRYYYLAKKI